MSAIQFMMPGFGFSYSRDRSRRSKRRMRAQNSQLNQRVKNLEQQLMFERLRNTKPNVQITNNFGNTYNGFNNQYLNNSSAFYNSNTLNAVAGMGAGKGDLAALSSSVGSSAAMGAGGSARYNGFHAVSWAHGQRFT